LRVVLSRGNLRVAEAIAEAVAPPTKALPQTPSDVGFSARLTRFVDKLPTFEALGLRCFLWMLNWLPLLVGPRRGRVLSLTTEERQQFLSRLERSRLNLLRLTGKTVLMLAAPVYYADAEVRETIGDRTHKRVATKSMTFPVEAGCDLSDDVLDVEVLVVGSGAGGAPLAARLAERGRSVAVLEAGDYRPSSSYPAIAHDALLDLYQDGGATMTFGRPPIAVPVGRLVGGTTVINSGTCFRVPEFVHQRWEREFAFPAELSAAALAPFYAEVEERLSVQPVTPDILGGNNEIARRGAEALGWSSGYLLRNARGCVGSNRCAFGCPTDGKQAMHITYLPDAVKSGARVFSGVRVERILFHKNRAVGVRARVRDASGKERSIKIRSDVVVVSAGTFNSPLLLRASGIRHRNLGKRLTIHPGVKISGLFPGENFYEGPGVPQSYYVDEFHERGIMMEGAHIPPDMASIALPGKGAQHKELMERSRELACYGFLVSDEPSGSVHRGFGNRPLLRYDISKNDLGKIVFGLKKLSQLFVAAGAEKLYLPTWKLPVLEAHDDMDALIDAADIRAKDLEVAAFHPLGTCGFGPSAKTFPLDTNLKVRSRAGLYVVDGSVMPSSLAVNPQLTIMALSTRLATHLNDEVL